MKFWKKWWNINIISFADIMLELSAISARKIKDERLKLFLFILSQNLAYTIEICLENNTVFWECNYHQFPKQKTGTYNNQVPGGRQSSGLQKSYHERRSWLLGIMEAFFQHGRWVCTTKIRGATESDEQLHKKAIGTHSDEDCEDHKVICPALLNHLWHCSWNT